MSFSFMDTVIIHCHTALYLHSVFPSIRVFSNESVLCIRWPKYWSFNFSISSSVPSLLYGLPLVSLHDYWKNHSFDMQTFVGKVMSLLFNMLSRFAIAFISRSKRLLISWQQSPSAVILEPKKIDGTYESTNSI